MKERKDYKKEYNDFWKDIVENRFGILKKDQVKRELADFSFLMEQASIVYSEVANLSKTSYWAETILGELDDRFWRKDYIKDDLKDMLKSYTNGDEKDFNNLVDWLKEYFELDEEN